MTPEVEIARQAVECACEWKPLIEAATALVYVVTVCVALFACAVLGG